MGFLYKLVLSGVYSFLIYYSSVRNNWIEGKFLDFPTLFPTCSRENYEKIPRKRCIKFGLGIPQLNFYIYFHSISVSVIFCCVRLAWYLQFWRQTKGLIIPYTLFFLFDGRKVIAEFILRHTDVTAISRNRMRVLLRLPNMKFSFFKKQNCPQKGERTSLRLKRYSYTPLAKWKKHIIFIYPLDTVVCLSRVAIFNTYFSNIHS